MTYSGSMVDVSTSRVESVILNEVKDPSTVKVSRAASSFSASNRFSFAFDLGDTPTVELT
jgi:hypothetical protein